MQDVKLNLEEELISGNFFHKFARIGSVEFDSKVKRYRRNSFYLLRNPLVRIKPVLKRCG